MKQNCLLLRLLRRASRAPRGARGLKQARPNNRGGALGRAPRGARGLKLLQTQKTEILPSSRPARGAWIETGIGPNVASDI